MEILEALETVEALAHQSMLQREDADTPGLKRERERQEKALDILHMIVQGQRGDLVPIPGLTRGQIAAICVGLELLREYESWNLTICGQKGERAGVIGEGLNTAYQDESWDGDISGLRDQMRSCLETSAPQTVGADIAELQASYYADWECVVSGKNGGDQRSIYCKFCGCHQELEVQSADLKALRRGTPVAVASEEMHMPDCGRLAFLRSTDGVRICEHPRYQSLVFVRVGRGERI